MKVVAALIALTLGAAMIVVGMLRIEPLFSAPHFTNSMEDYLRNGFYVVIDAECDEPVEGRVDIAVGQDAIILSGGFTALQERSTCARLVLEVSAPNATLEPGLLRPYEHSDGSGMPAGANHILDLTAAGPIQIPGDLSDFDAVFRGMQTLVASGQHEINVLVRDERNDGSGNLDRLRTRVQFQRYHRVEFVTPTPLENAHPVGVPEYRFESTAEQDRGAFIRMTSYFRDITQDRRDQQSIVVYSTIIGVGAGGLFQGLLSLVESLSFVRSRRRRTAAKPKNENDGKPAP